jgi:hypothetical protein
LKLKCDQLLSKFAFNFNLRLSNFAFNFNLRRYFSGRGDVRVRRGGRTPGDVEVASRERLRVGFQHLFVRRRGRAHGRAVQVDSIKTRVESAPGVCDQRLKLKCDEPLSNVAFNFNVRRYNLAVLNWLRDQGCPWNKETRVYAVNHNRKELLKWLDAAGAP